MRHDPHAIFITIWDFLNIDVSVKNSMEKTGGARTSMQFSNGSFTRLLAHLRDNTIFVIL